MTHPDATKRKPFYRPRNLIIALALIVAGFLALVIHAITRPLGLPGKYAAEIDRIVKAGQPVEGENGHTLLLSAVARQNQIEVAYAARQSASGGFGPTAAIFDLPGPEAARTEAGMLQREQAAALIEEFGKGGLLDALDKVAAAPWAARPTPEGALMLATFPELRATRQLARICGARLTIASERGDGAEVARAYEHGLALGRISCVQLSIIDHLVGYACVALANSRLREALIANPPEGDAGLGMIEDCLGALDRQTPLGPISRAFDCERIYALDTLEWTHTDDGHGGGLFVVSMGNTLGGGGAGPPAPGSRDPLGALGGLLFANKSETVAKLNELYANLASRSALSRPQRVAGQNLDLMSEQLPRRFAFIKMIFPALERALQSSDQARMDIMGTRLMLVLERWRIRTGHYPATLGELMGGDGLAALPVDPINDKGFGYRRIDAATDPARRGYILYALGDDGVDNGGIEPPNPNDRNSVLSGRSRHGFDYIINQPATPAPAAVPADPPATGEAASPEKK